MAIAAEDSEPPAQPVWERQEGDVFLRFFGRAVTAAVGDLAQRLTPGPDAIAHLSQVHGARVVAAEQAGRCGEADALVTHQQGLGLLIVTADCVPVLFAAGDRVAAAHAGWRGLVAGVLPATAAALGGGPPIRAWIGPAIGPCCYEVGADVAQAIATATSRKALAGLTPRPRIDLWAAAAAQLHALGVTVADTVRLCTRCHGGQLWSYRRDGSAAGRNYALIWRR